jgi:hypothetical protein
MDWIAPPVEWAMLTFCHEVAYSTITNGPTQTLDANYQRKHLPHWLDALESTAIRMSRAYILPWDSLNLNYQRPKANSQHNANANYQR